MLDVPTELLDGMEEFAVKFGLKACHEALIAASFSPRVTLPATTTTEVKLNNTCNHPSEFAFSLLSNENVFIHRNMSFAIHTNSAIAGSAGEHITQFLDRHYQRVLRWGAHHGTLSSLPAMKHSLSTRIMQPQSIIVTRNKSKLFQTLSIQTRDKSILKFLEHSCFAIFQEIEIVLDEKSSFPEDILNQLDFMTCGKSSQLRITLTMNSCILNDYTVVFIKMMLMSNSLCKLSLKGVEFDDASRSLTYLIQGLEAMKQYSFCQLESLILEPNSEVRTDVFSLEEYQRLIRALAGLPLREIQLVVPLDEGVVPNAICTDLLQNPNCHQLQTLALDFFWIHQDPEYDPESDGALPIMEKLFEGFEENHLIRNLTLKNSTIEATNLWHMTLIPECRYHAITIQEQEARGIEFWDLIEVFNDKTLLDLCDEALSAPSSTSSLPSRSRPINRIRKLDFASVQWPFANTEYLKETAVNIQILTQLMQSRYRYLCDVGMTNRGLCEARDEFVAAVLESTSSLPGRSDEQLGEASQNYDDPAVFQQKAWDDLLMQVECNFVGLALLDEPDPIPIALWPTTIAKSTLKSRNAFIATSDKKYPMDGLHGLVRGLYAGGPLSDHEYGRQENGKRGTTSPPSPSLRQKHKGRKSNKLVQDKLRES